MFGLHSQIGYQEIMQGIRVKTLNHGNKTLMAEFVLNKNTILPEHSHLNEQTGYLVSGKICLYINEISKILNPGDNWNIPSNIKHKAEIIEDSVAIEVFSPCREDYIQYQLKEDIIGN